MNTPPLEKLDVTFDNTNKQRSMDPRRDFSVTIITELVRSCDCILDVLYSSNHGRSTAKLTQSSKITGDHDRFLSIIFKIDRVCLVHIVR
jgi:hypothetical protein